ncbi:MAG: PBP1A family penicillin-binding protein [Deltaproteobacteria bacterium]|nr:MAG: PBP1A family penicillin-binding protein [Deltaproteobacteria bacterium]
MNDRPRRPWLRRLLQAGAAVAWAAVLAGGAGYWWFDQHILAELPSDLSHYREWRPPTNVRVLDVDGEVVDEFFVERRVWVDIEDLPEHVWRAFVSAEDRRFFEHKGVDPSGIVRAVVVNAKAGNKVQGASTLTQQLVKNLLVGSERSYTRKLKEAVLAYRLESEIGKDGVLELYLNYVPLGSGNYGVEAAARDYFGVTAAELDPGQAALLAGLVPAPSRYSPRANGELARERRRLVLRSMVRDEVLTDEEAATYLDDPVKLPSRPSNDKESAAYLTLVRREVRRLFGAEKPFELGLEVHTALDRRLQAVAEVSMQEAVEAHLARQGPLDGEEGPWAQAAAVVIETATGRVRAITGGDETRLEGFIRGAQATRQPGSSFKPYVYAAALREGYRQTDLVMDAPISLPAGGGKRWTPKNYGGSFSGPLPMRSALARSLNTVAVRLVLEVGPTEVASLARGLGVRTPLRTDPTIALGSSEVTPLDQALGYASLARGGVPLGPVYVDRVVDVHGRELAAAGETVALDPPVTLPGAPGRRVLDRGVAYEISDMLRAVVEQGTARKAKAPGRDRAGKTGTTNDNVDAWFVGFTAEHTVAVWVGTDGVRSLGENETGGKAALPGWIQIAEALGEPENLRREAPPEVLWRAVGSEWVAIGRGKGDKRPGSAPLPSFGRTSP